MKATQTRFFAASQPPLTSYQQRARSGASQAAVNVRLPSPSENETAPRSSIASEAPGPGQRRAA
ncbi:MAG: hypothetical protein R3D25_13490 [Geminicoccaceae bacterium]